MYPLHSPCAIKIEWFRLLWWIRPLMIPYSFPTGSKTQWNLVLYLIEYCWPVGIGSIAPSVRWCCSETVRARGLAWPGPPPEPFECLGICGESRGRIESKLSQHVMGPDLVNGRNHESWMAVPAVFCCYVLLLDCLRFGFLIQGLNRL